MDNVATAPSASTNDSLPQVTFMDWTVNIVDGSAVISKPASDLGTLPQGTAFWLSGTTTTAGYVYGLILGEHALSVLYPPTGTTDYRDAGVTMRLPDGASQYVAPIAGEIRVFSAKTPVQNSDWAKLFPGHDPPPKDSSGKDM